MIAVVATCKGSTFTWNVCVVLPRSTVTAGGTCTSPALLASETVRPPVGAGAGSVIVPCTGTPASDTLDASSTLCSAGTTTIVVTRFAVWLAPA